MRRWGILEKGSLYGALGSDIIYLVTTAFHDIALFFFIGYLYPVSFVLSLLSNCVITECISNQ
jgi:hypothetical protein